MVLLITTIRLLTLLFSISNVGANSKATKKPKRHVLQALDCRSPQSIHTGLLKQICGIQNNQTTEPNNVETVTIVQTSPIKVLSALKCTKTVTRLQIYCGAYSHMKFFAPPTIEVTEQFPLQKCLDVKANSLYVTEAAKTITLRPNHRTQYKYFSHGDVHSDAYNVECTGDTVRVMGAQHAGVVTMVTVTVSTQEVQIEVSQDKVVDLDSQTVLPFDCSKDMHCTASGHAYVIEPEKFSCPLYKIRTIPMKRVNVLVNDKEKEALVSNDPKIFLELNNKYTAPAECGDFDNMFNTNYPKLKVILGDIQTPAIPAISASILDIELESKLLAEFLSYELETMFKNQLQEMSYNLCHLSAQNLQHYETSPFHQHALLRLQGEVITEIICTPVQVLAIEGLTGSDPTACYTDLLPVYLAKEAVYLQANTRLIVEDPKLSQQSCEDPSFLPIFATNENVLLQATPTVQTVEKQLTHLGESYFHSMNSFRMNHEDFSSDILYTHSEIASFLKLLHFGRTKNSVINSLTSAYCAHDDCGDLQQTQDGLAFDISRLTEGIEEEFDIWKKIEAWVNVYGSWAGLSVALIHVLVLLGKLKTLFTLYFQNRLSAKDATILSFNIDHAVRNRLIPEHDEDANVTISTPVNIRSPRSRTQAVQLPDSQTYFHLAPMRRNPPRELMYEQGN